MGAQRDHPAKPEPEDQPYWQVFDAVGDGLIIQDTESLTILEANQAAAAMHGYSREEFLSLKVTDYLHPDSLPHFAESVEAVKSGGVLEAATVHVRRDGAPFHVEVRRTVFTYQSRACLLSVVRDVSKRVRDEELLLQQAEARRREQATLLDISHTLASTLELRPELILDQLAVIVQYSRAVLFVISDSALVAAAVRGVAAPEDGRPFRIPVDSPELLVQLFNEHRAIRIADVRRGGKQAAFMRAVMDRGDPAILDGVRSWMWVPVAVKGRIVGGIGVAQEAPDYFTKHHADLALTVANQAAITMMNAELYSNARELAVLEERQRLARNLHDAVNQSLFSAGLIAEVLPRLWEKDQPEARQSLEDLRRLTRGAMAEMRALLAELRPSTLTDAELGELLRLLSNAFTGRTNVPTQVNVQGSGQLPSNVQVAIYRICQEALNNISKHAHARHVELQLKQDKDHVDVEIRDDGRGFDQGQMPSGHYGLSMMGERAEAADVGLAITSAPGKGTQIQVHWPTTDRKERP